MYAILNFLAQTTDTTAETSKDNNALLNFLPIVLLIVVLYFLMIRPQKNRLRQHQELLSSIGLGDEVETIAGIYGTIRAMDDESFMIEVSPGTTVRMSRASVRRKIYQPDEEESSDSAS